jgi:hypothetical protein
MNLSHCFLAGQNQAAATAVLVPRQAPAIAKTTLSLSIAVAKCELTSTTPTVAKIAVMPADRIAVPLPLQLANGRWTIDWAALEKVVTPKIKLF